MDYHFDFYNYAGIHRPVTLYAVPADAAITDLTLTTDVTADHKLAKLKFEVLADVANEIDSPNLYCRLRLRDKTAKVVAEAKSCRGIMKVKSPHLWWPYLMSSDPGYLHDLEVAIVDSKRNATLDQYTTKVGIRSLTWDNSTIRVNHADFYFKGFGKHEDSDIRGKGLDLPLVAKDFNLINWIGANAFRTSHYPYAEEIMDFADANGIVVVDECPAVALDHFSDNEELARNHKEALDRLVSRGIGGNHALGVFTPTERYLQCLRLALSEDNNPHGLSDIGVADDPHQFTGVGDLLPVEIDNHVSGLNASFARRTFRNIGNQCALCLFQSKRFGNVLGHVLNSHTKPAASGFTKLPELIHNVRHHI